MPLNERTWTGHVISWIKESITRNQTIFQDATNDEGIKADHNKTRFPDILLFLNKTSGLIFNGWELKFPDTPVDDRAMLENALEKARNLESNSFVTWNGRSAIIWLITDSNYTIDSLQAIRTYPNEDGINGRIDLAVRQNYLRHEARLRARLLDILHDLEQLHREGTIREALNISSNIVEAITNVADQLIPLFSNTLTTKINTDDNFREEFGLWKILESSTLKILGTSSRRQERVDPILVLAKFTYYKLIGKILFYKTLAENLSGRVSPINLVDDLPIQTQLNTYFREAQEIDYQAVFAFDFTDALDFDINIERLLKRLLNIFSEIDFRFLPNEVIGNILENLVPKIEKQKFGQYFTSETLAYLVSMSALHNRDAIVMDPTSGTGTFLTAFYKILQYRGQQNHEQLLNQVWGNDISHFPAILSVINLYKQDLTNQNNFPRVTRRDYFHLAPGQTIDYPDPVNEGETISVRLPQFDVIASNFPFIQQEDIPNRILSELFRGEFLNSQRAFLRNVTFDINERSDYFVYCFYNSLKFVKPGGYLAAITSNAWLGKNYGIQFKRFILDNFSIKYIFRSKAEHWFNDSKVSTIYITLQKEINDAPTRFITVNFKLEDYFPGESNTHHIEMMVDLYNEINHCDHAENNNWIRDDQFQAVYHKKDGSISVSIVQRAYLEEQILTQENWASNFIAQDPISIFRSKLINPYPTLIDAGRGTRADSNDYQVLSERTTVEAKIESEFLIPAIKSSRHLTKIFHSDGTSYFLFRCPLPEKVVEEKYPNAWKWIQRFENDVNKKGIPYPIVLAKKRPYWYTLRVEEPANIFISLNPDKKLFFSYSEQSFYLDQRLVAIRVAPENLQILAALFNSIVSLLMVEFNGVSRSLGVLDLNADFFKTKMRILNPALLGPGSKQRILESFIPLAQRPIHDFDTEFSLPDRMLFDQTVLSEFGYSINILPSLYEMLIQSVRDRIEMKDR